MKSFLFCWHYVFFCVFATSWCVYLNILNAHTLGHRAYIEYKNIMFHKRAFTYNKIELWLRMMSFCIMDPCLCGDIFMCVVACCLFCGISEFDETPYNCFFVKIVFKTENHWFAEMQSIQFVPFLIRQMLHTKCFGHV